MPSHVLTFTWTRSGDQISKSITATDAGEANIDVALTALQANAQGDIAIDVSALKSLFIHSDVGCDIYTNAASGGSPDNHLTLIADKPLAWYYGCGLVNPLTVDVTKVYITNAANSVGTVKIRTIQDNEP